MSDHSSVDENFLDKNQYTRNKILLYERIFGPNCLSHGGPELIKEMCEKLNLLPGQRVLDVGCGIGGNSFHLAQEFGAEVLALDLSSNMLTVAAERLEKYQDIKNLVHFEHCDITKEKFADDTFDVIFSKDTILHIANKETLFKKFFRWLHPGGLLVIGDYCLGKENPSQEFRQYIQQRNYSLLTVTDYEKLLEKVGFRKRIVQDRNQFFVELLKETLKQIEEEKEELIRDYSKEDYDFVYYGVQVKLQYSQNHTWGFFLMQKPSK